MSATRLHAAQVGRPALAIHGGAGSRPAGDDAAVRARELDGLRAAVEAGWRLLDGGGTALDAAVAAVVSMEDSGLFNAGRGAVPTASGTVETDAGVMGLLPGADGWREVVGAACAMTWAANPILVARGVAETDDALLLAGPGADQFAAAAGLARRDAALLTRPRRGTPISDMGTVGAVALDSHGHLAAATSTGGRDGKPPGRVGDSPIIGAGTWAAEGGVAVSATGEGEAFIRAGYAERVEAAVRAGAPAAQAAADALAAVERWGGVGGAIVISAAGELVVVCDTPAMARGWRSASEQVVEILRPD